eukprot:1162036-Pelagomonas_calceolata.AAC.12
MDTHTRTHRHTRCTHLLLAVVPLGDLNGHTHRHTRCTHLLLAVVPPDDLHRQVWLDVVQAAGVEVFLALGGPFSSSKRKLEGNACDVTVDGALRLCHGQCLRGNHTHKKGSLAEDSEAGNEAVDGALRLCHGQCLCGNRTHKKGSLAEDSGAGDEAVDGALCPRQGERADF